ncbi:MAG: thioredoxin domain-containing protein [Ruminococcaceae bacterium]|nr:thioredoxin domain-containing protein [Oscillospiraceae bacterium]
MSNHLKNETSPYLLQHKDNPVDWYPWSNEAFEMAKTQDKPVFLSIGYSACHWCHVFSRESFEDEEIADILNKHFISIKVDKEERPDIDSVYMSVCQAFTGSGGWPTSIFMTCEQMPFFAGTYFPRISHAGMIGFRELLLAIHEKWVSDRESLLNQSYKIVKYLNTPQPTTDKDKLNLPDLAVSHYEQLFDEKYGGFGRAPKFPTPHNILFLFDYYVRYKKSSCLFMAKKTLLAMYRGGLFDHIGFGFCRYSTDNKFLVPHFEKMLYDNALLILAYCKAYTVTKNKLYLETAKKTAGFIIRNMTSTYGGYFSSYDADSEGEEGKYYTFAPDEINKLLGKEKGELFNRRYDISQTGNFEGKSIPNLLKSDPGDNSFDTILPIIENYRKRRSALHRDEKILTSWNSLMIAAMCKLFLISKNDKYLDSAKFADDFLQKNLFNGDELYVSYHSGKLGVRGFLDDYASYIFAQLSLYRTTLEQKYFERAKALCDKVISDFGDADGGFYLYSNKHENLILCQKETYDGAIPSGNSLMFFNLVRLSLMTDDNKYKDAMQLQLEFLTPYASQTPTGYGMFLKGYLEHIKPPLKITVVADGNTEESNIALSLPSDAIIIFIEKASEKYPLKNGMTTYYACHGNRCLPPTNSPEEVF